MKKNLKNLMTLPLILFALGLSACSLKIPNELICVDRAQTGSFCAWTIKGENEYYSKPEWDEKRFGWFCMSPESFAAYQKFIETSCEKHGCVEGLNEEVSRVRNKLLEEEH